MNRRALLTRGWATLLASVLPFTLLSQDTQAATALTKAQIAKSSEVKRLLSGFWSTALRLSRKGVSNDHMVEALDGYLAENGLQMPVVFSHYVTIRGKQELVSVTFHRMIRETRDDGVQELRLVISAPKRFEQFGLGNLEPHLLNMEMPRA